PGLVGYPLGELVSQLRLVGDDEITHLTEGGRLEVVVDQVLLATSASDLLGKTLTLGSCECRTNVSCSTGKTHSLASEYQWIQIPGCCEVETTGDVLLYTVVVVSLDSLRAVPDDSSLVQVDGL